MKEAYKQKIDDLMVSVDGRLTLIEKMMTGEKRPDNKEALHYMQEVKKGLESVKEIISIS